MRRTILILISLIFIITSATRASAEESSPERGKYGWVDLKKVMKTYYKTEEMLAQFEEEKAAKEAEVTKLVEEIEKMEGKLLLLSKTARKEKEEAILRKKMEVNAMIQEAEQELGNKSRLKQETLLKDIIAVSDELADEGGYTFIFRGEVLLYKDPALDITDRIIAILNKGEEKSENSEQ
ncbi:MAG: OmpH family outer membrane protein [Candidatus Auribacterota bacterium]|nr:OmpH family outer membrane protein [Candidatus Auribacterota bacterium]